jgi:hypothetical protein
MPGEWELLMSMSTASGTVDDEAAASLTVQ